MSKYILFLLFINIHLVAYNQIISGVVLDKQTINPISFAAIYFNGTFVGTTSDQDGHFELDITKYVSRPLTISAVGYYSFTLTDLLSGESNIIYLTPKVYEIKEVSVSTKSLTRKRRINLALFKKEFLGTSYNARKCEIMNEDDISFNYDSNKDTLKAFALKPILIKNSALGYTITYYLDKFEFEKRTKTTYFVGDILFKEDLTNSADRRSYERRRSHAYSGSSMQFFRALWNDDLESTNFKIKIPEGKELTYKDVVIQEDNNRKYLKYAMDLEIEYFPTSSNIEFRKEKVRFEQNGFFDPSGILWRGHLARMRIADWLPFEYPEALE